MNCETGEIKNLDILRKELGDSFEQKAKEIDPKFLSPLRQRQLADKGTTKIGRNESCPCGSGRKFKKCCILVA